MWDMREVRQCEKRPPLRAFAVRGYKSLKAPSCPWGASLGPLGAILLKTVPFFASRRAFSERFRCWAGNDDAVISSRCSTGPFLDASDGMLEFPDEEVQFKGGLRFHSVQVWHDDIRERLTEVMQLVGLVGLVGITMQFKQFAFQGTDFREGLNDCEGRGGCLRLFRIVASM